MFNTGFESYDIYEILDLIERIIDIIKNLFGSFLSGANDTETE